MKICITAAGEEWGAPTQPNFGRAPYFLIIDSEAETIEARFAEVGRVKTRVVRRGLLGVGTPIEGPAIVVGSDSTLLVPPGIVGHSDRLGTIHLEVR